MTIRSHSQPESLTNWLQTYRVLSAAVLCSGCTVAFVFLSPAPASAQEALKNSLAGEAAAEARHERIGEQPYTIKSGDFRLLAVPSIGLDWNDNINLSKTNALQDFILRPTVQLNASYPLTQWNLLSVDVGIGYDRYLENPGYSTVRLNGGSGLSFDAYIKDLWVNLHDRVRFVQDTAQEPTLANTANYNTIDNTVGVLTTWDLRDLTLTLGYDHLNVFPQTSQYQYLTRSTESLVGRSGLRLHPQIVVGVEATAAFTTYEQTVLNNNDAYTVGGYADWRPGSYFHVQPRAGYAVYLFQNTSTSIQTSDVNSWYASLKIIHQITDQISYSLDGGRESSLGTHSDLTENWYVRPSLRWQARENAILHTSLSYEDGSTGKGNVVGNLTENYSWLAWRIGLSYRIMKKLSTSLSYRLTIRTSNNSNREYTQNVLGIELTYVP